MNTTKSARSQDLLEWGLMLSLFAILCGGCSRATDKNVALARRDLAQSARALSSLICGAVVYEHRGGIYKTTLGETNCICLAEEGSYPRWSPDGTRVAFLQQGSLVYMNSDGSDVEIIAKPKEPRAIAWHPNGKRILFTDGRAIHAIDLDGSAPTTIASGFDFRELDLSEDAERLIATVMNPTRLLAFNLQTGAPRMLAKGCSASLSPDGRRVTNNLRGHQTLAIRSWTTGEIVTFVSAPDGYKFDNQFWSNHPDWLASMVEGRHEDIFVHNISNNQPFRITSLQHCDRPDLYVTEVQPNSGADR